MRLSDLEKTKIKLLTVRLKGNNRDMHDTVEELYSEGEIPAYERPKSTIRETSIQSEREQS